MADICVFRIKYPKSLIYPSLKVALVVGVRGYLITWCKPPLEILNDSLVKLFGQIKKGPYYYGQFSCNVGNVHEIFWLWTIDAHLQL